MALKRYSKQEPLVFLYVLVPYIFFMNLLIFGGCILFSMSVMLKAFAISTVYFSIIYAAFGFVAVRIQMQFNKAGELFKRIRVMLPIFYLMNIGAVHGVFFFYKVAGLIHCPVQPERLWWTILYACIMSTVITFINEGMANWEKWKNSLSEREKLTNAYQRSKLLGLKGQINPHFLFNCFNTLSGLIHEDEEKAEEFLDEMTKVHRYLLRGDDEYLVTLGDEMKFAKSYLSLIKARFGDAINIGINLSQDLLHKQIPPLSMQVILENIIYTNALNKKSPLTIKIFTKDNDKLVISHSIHVKIIVQNLSVDEGLDNLITKYRLLNARDVEIIETPMHREIVLRLFDDKTVAA